jgi:hypothetical protein
MKIDQLVYTQKDGWQNEKQNILGQEADLIIAFGQRELLEDPGIYDHLAGLYKNPDILLASTAGEIIGERVLDGSVVATVIKFESTTVKSVSININLYEDNFEAGKEGTKLLPSEGLRHLFVIADGQNLNGTKLVEGIRSVVPENVSVTGGLAGDGAKFEKTLVGLNSQPKEGELVFIGFYGENISVGYASRGGWDTFGPMRLITKSVGNILYELDGKSALAVYKKYLGDKASGLPGAALLFPLAIQSENPDEPLVRTILAVNNEEQSMIFAGDIPQGAQARFMKTNFDRLIEGAATAAGASMSETLTTPELAILISCVGRKIVLGQRVEEEVEVVNEKFTNDTAIIGFYSYGEISPFNPSVSCNFHNQTMTITTFSER